MGMWEMGSVRSWSCLVRRKKTPSCGRFWMARKVLVEVGHLLGLEGQGSVQGGADLLAKVAEPAALWHPLVNKLGCLVYGLELWDLDVGGLPTKKTANST